MDYTLNESRQVTLDSTGAGRVQLGPGDGAGPRTWEVSGCIVQTNRPGVAPVPRVQVFLDEESARGSQGTAYDGSFNSAVTSSVLTVNAGSHLICVWAGGAAGDIASFTVTGVKR